MIDGTHVYDFDAAKVHEAPKHVDLHGKTLELSGNCFDEAIAVGYVADPYFESDKGSEHLRLHGHRVYIPHDPFVSRLATCLRRIIRKYIPKVIREDYLPRRLQRYLFSGRGDGVLL
jgi:hypothetical protein